MLFLFLHFKHREPKTAVSVACTSKLHNSHQDNLQISPRQGRGWMRIFDFMFKLSVLKTHVLMKLCLGDEYTFKPNFENV